MDERSLTRARADLGRLHARLRDPFMVVGGRAAADRADAVCRSRSWSFVHAWVIPELFAHRGARVCVPARALGRAGPERTAQGLLGDLLDHEPRELHARAPAWRWSTGRLGVWLVGEAGALLVRPSGRRVHCFCVRAADPRPAARRPHRAPAARAARGRDGFATVANHAFTGATWRMRRRIPAVRRPALDAADGTRHSLSRDQRS